MRSHASPSVRPIVLLAFFMIAPLAPGLTASEVSTDPEAPTPQSSALVDAAVLLGEYAEIVEKGNPKLEGVLAKLCRAATESPMQDVLAIAARRNVELTAGGLIEVVLDPPVGEKASSIDLSMLEYLGGKLSRKSEHWIVALVPLARLEEVAESVPGVRFVHLMRRPEAEYYTSEGVGLTGASLYHQNLYWGQGVKVAVIDQAFGNLSNTIAAGELPPVHTLNLTGAGMESGSSQHGTGIAEIIHDMAPGADLFLIKVAGEPDVENAIDSCIAEDIDVINMSLGFKNVNFFDGQGLMCEKVNQAKANGILFVKSAGNSRDDHNEGSFVDANHNGFHEFAPGDELLRIYSTAGNSIRIDFTWDDWEVTDQDYDVLLYDASLNYLTGEMTRQTGFQPPYEVLTYAAPYTGYYYIALGNYSASGGHKYELYVTCDSVHEHQVFGSSITTPGDAEGAMAVGAVAASSWVSGPSRSYSSEGPTNDGRMKPEVVGPDGVTLFNGGSAEISGTSFSAPHVAGAAALIKSVHPEYSVDQLWTALTSSAVDMGAPGQDNIYGYGRLNLPDILVASPGAFHAAKGDGEIRLTWTNPPDADFKSVRVLYGYSGYPHETLVGGPVENGNDGFFSGTPGSSGSWTHAGRTNGLTCYYSIYATNGITFSPPLGAFATPADTLSPAPVTQFAAQAGDSTMVLTWRNPSTEDFQGVYIAYSAATYPNTVLDGLPLPNGNNGLVPGTPGDRDTISGWGLPNGVTHYFSAFAYDEVPNYSVKATTFGTPQDVTAPSPVLSFTAVAGDTTVQLSWTNPSDADFAGTLIRYSQTNYPSTPSAGSPVPNGNEGRFAGAPSSAGSFAHQGLTNGAVYFYSAFAYDEVPNYSTAANAQATPTDATAPSVVSSFTAVSGNGQATLSWANPSDPDFTGTVVRFSTSSYPSTPTAGTAVPNGSNGDFAGTPGSNGSFTHTGLANGTTYYYSAFAHDEVPNYSAAANAQAVPGDATPPDPVTAFTARKGDREVLLSWTNPSTADFSATTIRFSTSAYPSGPTDGTAAPNGSSGVFSGSPGSAGSFTHSGLTNGTTYYYSAFAADVSNNYASAVQASAIPADTLAPSVVTNFQAQAGDGQVALSWRNPSDSDFAGTLVRFSTTSTPAGPTSGQAVPNGNEGRFTGSPGSNGTYTHTGLTNGTVYYYAAFAYDEVPNYASGASGTATPQDVTPPGAPTSFTATAGEGEVKLRWNHPADADVAGTLIRFSTVGTPASPTSGSPVPNGSDGKFTGSPAAADSFAHTGLTNGTTYYYAAFAYDEVPNYSTAATASALPQDTVAPTLTIGVLQNPYFTANLDLYLVASEPLNSGSVSMTVGGAPVGLQLNDSEENVWKGDYAILGSGVIALAASAEDLAGNQASVSGSFTAKMLLARVGGTVTSPDGVMELRIGPGVLGADACFLMIPSGLTAGAGKATIRSLRPGSYEVYPKIELRGREAEVVFRYRVAGLASEQADRLYVRDDQTGRALPSFVDLTVGTVSAGITEISTYSLQIGQPGSSVPADPSYALLEQNRPNPFNPVTTIGFEIRASQLVRLDIFGITGDKTCTLVDSYLPAGTHSVSWDGTDESGEAVPSGVYFYRLRTQRTMDTKKMLLIR